MDDIGERLRRERERQCLTLGAVEARTKIRAKFLEAIESGAFSVIPGEVYVKGFLRTYAEFLGLDGAAVLDEYKRRRIAEVGGESPAERAQTECHDTQEPGKLRRSPLSRRVILLLTLLLIGAAVGALVAVRPGAQLPSDVAEEAPPSEIENEALTSESGTVEPATASGSVSAAETGVDLEVAFSDRCWVEVTADGQLLLSKTYAKGESARWQANERLRVRFGNGAAASIRLNGADVGVAGKGVTEREFTADQNPGGEPGEG